MPDFLDLRAGPAALARIRADGLRPEFVSHFGAAAGGPKWLVLGHLDRAMFTHWFGADQPPVIATGASAGAWRLACLCQRDPVAAIDRFEQAYLTQHYSDQPDAAEVSRQGAKILDALLGQTGLEEIPRHRWLKLNVVTARARRGTGSRRALVQALALAAASLANLIHRRALARFLQRVLVHAPDGPLQLRDDGFDTVHVPMDAGNLRPALMASASIPRVMEPVAEIPGAPPGPYIDGGMIDYHMDLPLADRDGLTLIPHFAARITTGWLDKYLPWRQPRHLDRALVISPSAAMLARFANGRIPDRHDFARYDDDRTRIRDWQRSIAESRAMADEFIEIAERDAFAARVRPL